MKLLFGSFHLNNNIKGFIHRLESWNHLLQHNEQNHRKVLLSGLPPNGHT